MKNREYPWAFRWGLSIPSSPRPVLLATKLVFVAWHLAAFDRRNLRMNTPSIAITMGDPAGIGPEIMMKALARPSVHDVQPVDHRLCPRLRLAGDIVGSPLGSWRSTGRRRRNSVNLRPMCRYRAGSRGFPFGEVSAISGEAAYDDHEGVEVVRSGQAQAICTAPLSKEALHAAGHRYPATRIARPSHRHDRGVDDAGLTQAARHSCNDYIRPPRRHRQNQSRPCGACHLSRA